MQSQSSNVNVLLSDADGIFRSIKVGSNLAISSDSDLGIGSVPFTPCPLLRPDVHVQDLRAMGDSVLELILIPILFSQLLIPILILCLLICLTYPTNYILL